MGVNSGKMPMTAAKRLYDQMLAIATESMSNTNLGYGKLVVDQQAALTQVGTAQMDVLTEDLTFKMACDEFIDFNTGK